MDQERPAKFSLYGRLESPKTMRPMPLVYDVPHQETLIMTENKRKRRRNEKRKKKTVISNELANLCFMYVSLSSFKHDES